ncbi:MAG: L-seryl-tRNA(Sec) selenium transferase [Armatimonadota bacterium]
MKKDILRKLPAIDELMNTEALKIALDKHDREFLADSCRKVVDTLRSRIITEDKPEMDLSAENIGLMVLEYIDARFRPSIRHAVNAAGIILHTGLGRAMLSEAAAQAVSDVIKGYCTLATSIETGQRDSRDVHVTGLLRELTGAEAATIVNNNAAATMLILNTIAAGKEVIVSRGQLVEIGGAFRMPDVMAASGAIMREVGTTNKTHLRDYASAINENTGAILHVHQSNYRIVGFTAEPAIEEMAPIAKEHGIPIIDDLGSGALIDLANYGLEPEPMVQASVKAGCDAICFSGDKLIGGPQSGIIVGKENTIKKIKKNPLARALRVGKMEVAALEATLKLFLEPGRLEERHPTYRMLSIPLDVLERRALTVAAKLGDISAEVSVIDGRSQVGSGSVPAETMPTKILSIKPESMSADLLAKKLRYNDTPIFARIHHESVLFDFRTIQPDEDSVVANALRAILNKKVHS